VPPAAFGTTAQPGRDRSSATSVLGLEPAGLGGAGLILMELACITTVADKVRKVVERYARPAIAGTLAGSALMNAFAFASDADTLTMQAAGSIMGCAIPGLIYCLTRIGAALYIDCHARA
jgi:hypothetical protein